jgi:FMN phosphatase YigB (HAD superfamily)
VKAVTFDLWLTLIWDTQELEEYRKLRRIINIHRFIRKLGPRVRSKVTYDHIRLAMEELSVKVKTVYERELDISPEERGKMLFDLLQIKLPWGEAEQVIKEAGRTLSDSGYYKHYPHVNPEAEPAIRALKEKYPGIKIGLISNAARSSKTYGRMMRHFGIDHYFDNLTISTEIGFLKPRREIFEASLHSLGVKPHEALHVGDLFSADVVGACGVGMNAALYTGLWHKYAQYMNPGEHMPRDFKPRTNIIAKEIRDLRKVVELVGLAGRRTE